jgi:hypothetical protein
MASVLIGFKKQMHDTIPSQYATVLAKRDRLEADLTSCHEDATFLRGLAAAAGISLDTVSGAGANDEA